MMQQAPTWPGSGQVTSTRSFPYHRADCSEPVSPYVATISHFTTTPRKIMPSTPHVTVMRSCALPGKNMTPHVRDPITRNPLRCQFVIYSSSLLPAGTGRKM